MLFGAVSVLVVLASGEPGDGSTRAIEQALHTALGRDAMVVVKTGPEEDASPHQLVCVVSWSDHQKRVIVRMAKTTRELRFEPSDAANERGRTVGFALASMMPDEVFADPPPAAAPSPSPPPPPPPPFVDSPILTSVGVERPSLEVVPRENPLALDAVAIATGTPDGYGGGVGGMFAMRVPLVGALGFHGAFSARAGSIPPAAASLHVIGMAAGLAWQPWLDARHRWAAGARVDANIAYLDVDHLDADDAHAKHLSRFLPGASALAEGTYRFSEHAAIVSAVGAQVDFGETELFLEDRRVGALKPLKVVAELGLRVSFP